MDPYRCVLHLSRHIATTWTVEDVETLLSWRAKAQLHLQSQPISRASIINPILHGWVNYFRLRMSSQCFGYVKDWVEKKIGLHLMKA